MVDSFSGVTGSLCRRRREGFFGRGEGEYGFGMGSRRLINRVARSLSSGYIYTDRAEDRTTPKPLRTDFIFNPIASYIHGSGMGTSTSTSSLRRLTRRRKNAHGSVRGLLPDKDL